ncbi:uncharacterized protein DS421_14g464360 [Arachis hypogaea]|nr:uncharacterized protein DS421_14g464360 [Arachis hypogaea]
MLTCNHPLPPNRYNDSAEDLLRLTGFYHASQIGVVQCQKALVNALIERWHPETHTFHLPIGECAVSLEDVALILGLPTDGLPVTGMTMSSFEALEAECLIQFGVAPLKSDCRGSCIRLTWLRNLKENLELTDDISIQRYVRCHIMLLIGTILFGDKSGAGVHWKFLPLLRDVVSIGQYSWGSASLAHLYRALCRASRYNCKEIDGPLTLLLCWAWMRLPYLSPLPREPRSFPLANRWRNWERGDRRYRYLKLDHFRKAFDELQEGQFVWVAYAVDRVDPNIIPPEIYMQSVVWSATVPLVSFECIEWHATDRFRRQFGLVQGQPNQERNLEKAHGEVLTGPKNLNWATASTHSVWVMHWSNRYNYVLSELPMPSHNTKLMRAIRIWMRIIRKDLDADNEGQEPRSPHMLPPNPIPVEQPQSSSHQLLGFMSGDPGLSQYGHQPEFMAGRYSLDARYPGHTSSVASGGFVSVDSSRSDGGRGAFFTQNPNRVSMGLIEENANTLEKETDAYLVDDEEDDIEDIDEDEESRNDGQERTPDETSKGYNLRVDPPRRSANRYTPSVLKKAAKKCKNFVKDVKWAIRK